MLIVVGAVMPDADTVRALFTNRMHVLRDYRRQVIRPVFRELARQDSRKFALTLRTYAPAAGSA